VLSETKKTRLAELRIRPSRQKTTGTVFAFEVISRMPCHQSFLAHGQRTQAGCLNLFFIFYTFFCRKTSILTELHR
jgi:hypothetical protein